VQQAGQSVGARRGEPLAERQPLRFPRLSLREAELRGELHLVLVRSRHRLVSIGACHQDEGHGRGEDHEAEGGAAAEPASTPARQGRRHELAHRRGHHRGAAPERARGAFERRPLPKLVGLSPPLGPESGGLGGLLHEGDLVAALVQPPGERSPGAHQRLVRELEHRLPAIPPARASFGGGSAHGHQPRGGELAEHRLRLAAEAVERLSAAQHAARSRGRHEPHE
jgi:hypothetical protein